MRISASDCARCASAGSRTPSLSLTEANRIEPENPVVSANLGIVYIDLGRTA